jgi:hypothetical protein
MKHNSMSDARNLFFICFNQYTLDRSMNLRRAHGIGPKTPTNHNLYMQNHFKLYPVLRNLMPQL